MSKFIKENREFLLEVFGKWTKQTSLQFFLKVSVVMIVLVMSGILAVVGKIGGETFAGIVGVVLGYIFGKGVL